MAELNPLLPRSSVAPPIGRPGFDVYAYAKWIYFRIVAHKQRRYGAVATRTIPVLYVTHWQFIPSQSTVDCLAIFAPSEVVSSRACLFC